jgi:pimeloyl-ACP methyl ester carboxylesterase
MSHLRLPSGRFRHLAWGPDDESRPPAVLLHANAGSAESWAGVGPGLADRFRVHALDLRGHGGSDRQEDYGLPAAAADVISFMDALDLTGTLLVGHSWGAAVALVAAAGAGSRVGTLVLADPPPEVSPARLAGQLESLLKVMALPEPRLRGLLAGTCPHWHPRDVDSLITGFAQADPDIVCQVIADGAGAGLLLPTLAWLILPTLILRADPALGGLLPNADWQEARSLLPPDSAALDLPGVSHHIHRDRPEDFVRSVRDFALTRKAIDDRRTAHRI